MYIWLLLGGESGIQMFPTYMAVIDFKGPVVSLVVGKAGPWKPLYLGTTCWQSHKVSKSPYIWGNTPYPYSVKRIRFWSTVSYDFLRSRNNRKRGAWSMMAISWASFSSIISVPVPLLDLNFWRTSFICSLARSQELISDSINFHRVSNRPMPLVLVVTFGIRTRIVHPNSWGISPVCHMCFTRSNRNIHCFLRRGVFECYPGYGSCCHCLKWFVRRWVCPYALCGRRRCTVVSTSASDGISLSTFAGSACVARVRTGGCGSYIW